MSYASLSQVGGELFQALFITEVVLVSLVGPLVTGGVIALERERRTLELLFMTPLSDLEIVLGKLLARMAYLGGLVLLSLPVLLGCLMFGGVAPDDILLAGLLVFLSGLWSGAIGLFLSALAKQGYVAVIGTYLVLAAQTLGLPLLAALTWNWGSSRSPWFFLTSPQLYGMARILDEGKISFWGVDLWPYATAATLLGALGLAAAAARVLRQTPESRDAAPARPATRRPAQDGVRRGLSLLLLLVLVATGLGMAVTAPKALVKSEGFAVLPLGGFAYVLFRLWRDRRRAPEPRRRVWENPVAWKEVAFGRSPGLERLICLTLLAVVGFMYLILASEGRIVREPEFHGSYLGLELCLAMVLAVVLGAVAFAQEAEAGRLDLLLGTPLAPSKLVLGKLLGVAAALAPLTIFLGLHAAGSLAVCNKLAPADVLRGLFLASLMLYAHAVFAMAVGLSTRRTGVAIGVSLAVGVCLYLFLPILTALLRNQELFMLQLHLNPATALVVTFSTKSRYASVAEFGPAVALSVYLLAAAGLHGWMVRRFDRLVRRCT